MKQHKEIPACTLERAQFLINRFRELHSQDGNTMRNLDFITSSYLSGDGNKSLRQAVIFCITHEVKPIAKCTQFAVSNALQATISQSQLF